MIFENLIRALSSLNLPLPNKGADGLPLEHRSNIGWIHLKPLCSKTGLDYPKWRAIFLSGSNIELCKRALNDAGFDLKNFQWPSLPYRRIAFRGLY